MTDLLEELRDGHVLLSLLEVLLGTTLVSLLIANASMHVYLFRFVPKKQTNKKSSAVFFYFSNSANDFQHSHTVSSAAERKERGRQCLLIMCAIEFVCFTEKSRRSNACEQAQQCSHGVETAGAK